MEWFECKGDVEGVKRLLWSEYGEDGVSSVEVFQLDEVLAGRLSEVAVSAGPLLGLRICLSTPEAGDEEIPVEVPEMDEVIGGGGTRACIIRIRHIAIRI